MKAFPVEINNINNNIVSRALSKLLSDHKVMFYDTQEEENISWRTIKLSS
jgi:hypothetical protein